VSIAEITASYAMFHVYEFLINVWVLFSAGVTEIVFDRNGYLYHGRVKSLAEAAREAGLKF